MKLFTWLKQLFCGVFLLHEKTQEKYYPLSGFKESTCKNYLKPVREYFESGK